MAGITRIEIRETPAELEGLIQEQSNPNLKERLQVLYLLQLPNAMSVSAVAKVIGRHQGSESAMVEPVSRHRAEGFAGNATKFWATQGDSRVGSEQSETAFG
jgi:hypothetical protein